MKTILIFIILLLCTITLFSEELFKEMSVEEQISAYFGDYYYFEKIKITPQNYVLTISMHYNGYGDFGYCRIDIIHNGDLDTPYETVGYQYGTDVKLKSNNKQYFKFDVIVPRSDNKVYVDGMSKYDNNAIIDLYRFSKHIPKSLLTEVKKTIGYVYATVNANVRSGAGKNYKIKGQVKTNDKLALKQETNKWYRFYSNNFSDGWIAKSLTTKTLPKPIDNQKPKINLYQPEITEDIFRTEDFSSIIKGKATDNDGIFQVYINNDTATLKSNGQFQKRIKLKIGKNTIEIKAIDINDNETTKEFLIIRDEIIEEEEFSDIDFALETSNNKPNAIAVVFGIEEYQYAPSVSNAYNDAEIMREYLISTFGLKRKNIYFRYNERATKGEFEKVFSKNGWIAKNANKNSEIYVFYAGHGVASTEDGNAYLIPNDIDPNYASTGYSVNELYQNLSKIKSKSTIIILDACFSGISRENEMLLADSRPISIEVKQGSIPNNLNVFTASSGSEISSGYSQKMHGLFTYFFLKGLNKNADINNDKKITLGEMEQYLKEYVSSQAKKMGREQNPQLHTSDKDKILLKY